MNITLLDKKQNKVISLIVAQGIIGNSACLVYNSRYYIYSALKNHIFIFNEVDPPVEIGAFNSVEVRNG